MSVRFQKKSCRDSSPFQRIQIAQPGAQATIQAGYGWHCQADAGPPCFCALAQSLKLCVALGFNATAKNPMDPLRTHQRLHAIRTATISANHCSKMNWLGGHAKGRDGRTRRSPTEIIEVAHAVGSRSRTRRARKAVKISLCICCRSGGKPTSDLNRCGACCWLTGERRFPADTVLF